MPTIVDRAEMVKLLREEYAAVAEICRELDEGEWSKATCLPGWTVQDQLSHLVGTERMLDGQQPDPVEVSGASHVRNDIGRANEIWVESLRVRTGPQVLAAFDDVTRSRLTTLDAMTQADFDEPSWTPAGANETYGRFMRIRHFDCFMHEHDMREALGLPARDDSEHLASALSEPEAALGFIVGKRAGMPAGATVRIDLTGTVERTYRVAVAERAAFVDELDGEPTVSLSLPAGLFLRLAGGRREVGDLLGTTITLSGDRGLGEQLVSNLTFTI